jgi:type IV pilus assembly protein PilW
MNIKSKNMKLRNYPYRESGLSLIEIMIALVLSMMLLIGTASIFISNKRIYREQDHMGRLQENARFIMQKLFDEIRMSGYVGCSDDFGGEKVKTIASGATGGSLNDFSNIIEGYEGGVSAAWTPSGNSGIPANIVANTDAITFRYIRGVSFGLSNDMANEAAPVQVPATAGFLENDIVAIHDCAGADIFRITGVSTSGGIDSLAHAVDATTGNTTGTLGHAYQNSSGRVSRFVNKRYYIADENDGNGPALYDTGTRLIDGVENMQILYGEDTTGDSIADEFRTAEDVANWTNVTSVRLAVLLRTVDEDTGLDPNTSKYYLFDQEITAPGDQRRRRVATTTILIRNRDI